VARSLRPDAHPSGLPLTDTLGCPGPAWRAVNAERVALIPSCAECEARWLPADEERWQAWLTCDEPPELAFY
jgi:hypothetical protein